MNTDNNPAAALLTALRAIVTECMDYPPVPRYSADSYLPPHLLKAAQEALELAGRNTPDDNQFEALRSHNTPKKVSI